MTHSDEDSMPGLDEMESKYLWPRDTSQRPPRNALKRLRRELDEEESRADEAAALHPEEELTRQYIREQRSWELELREIDAVALSEISTNKIQVTTLNVGSWKYIMLPGGVPTPSFVMLLTTRQRQACVLFLQEVHLKHTEALWMHFTRHMASLVPWLKISKLVGPKGTALLYSRSLGNVSENIISPTQNTVRLEIRRTNDKDNSSRTVLFGVYFPFKDGKLSEIIPTLNDIRLCTTSVASNFVCTTGDFNAERCNKKAYSAELAKAGLKQVRMPVPTGKPQRKVPGPGESKASDSLGGGRAQGIWTNKPESVTDVDVLTLFDDLSNHHRPVVFNIPWQRSERPSKQLDLYSEMRKMRPKWNLGDKMNKVTTFEELMATVHEGTMLSPTHSTYIKRRKKKDVTKTMTKQEKNRRCEKIRAAMSKTLCRKEREMFDACLKNSPHLKTAIFRKEPDVIPGTEEGHPNQLYAEAMKTLSFCKKNIEPREYFAVSTVFGNVPDEIKDALQAVYTWEELIEARKMLGHTKTYADFDASIAHVMCDIPLKIMAMKFTEWAQLESCAEWELMYSKLIGIPTNKPHKETEILRMLQKMRRPIGILPLFRAWFYCAQAIRMRKLLVATAPKNMHGSIPGREGHEMCLRLLVMVKTRERAPLWVVQMDLVKYYDVIQHQLISMLDDIIKLPKPFFEVLSAQFASVTHKVRIVQGHAAMMTQESGGTQGTSTVPALAALILAPLAQKINKAAETSQREECPSAPPGMRSVDMFVDDMDVISDTSRDAIARVEWARASLKLIGVDAKIVAVACNESAMMLHRHDFDPDREPDYDPRCVFIDGERYEIQHSIRLLGCCIHLTKNSECAKTRCKRCNDQGCSRICNECEQEVLFNVRALPVKQTDKVECINQRVLASMSYGAYSCEKQRQAMVKVENSTRKILFGYGAGGYIEGAHLPAKKMGLGLRDTRRFLAIETAAIIERSLAREDMIPRVAYMLEKTGSWPDGITTALQGHDDENMIEIRLHDELKATTVSQRERVQIQWRSVQEQLTTVVTAIAYSDRGPERVLRRSYCCSDSGFATVRCLADIIETLRLQGCQVFLEEPLPKEIAKRVQPFKDVFKTIGTPNRVFYSVLARIQVYKFMASQGFIVHGRVPAEHSALIPEAYPLVVKLWGKIVVTGSTRSDLTQELNIRQEEDFWTRNRQLKQVCEPLHLQEIRSQFSLEATCPIASIRRGIYHISEMPARRANFLMRLFTGAIFKTPDRDRLKDDDFCKFPGCAGPDGKKKLLSIWHMLDHVPHEQRIAAVAQVKMIKPQWEWTHEVINLHCLLGLVHRNFTRYEWSRETEKEHTQYLKKAAAIFAELGLQAVEKCMGTDTNDTTPELEVIEKHLRATDFRYQGYADAATYSHTVGIGIHAKRVYFLGLGGVVRNSGGVVAKFQVRVEVPKQLFNSTVGEHLAHIVLIKVAKYHECDDVCFLCDNNSVPAHLEGEFSCNTPEINVIRRITYSLLRGMNSERGWLPRLKNVESDSLAKDAAKNGVTVAENCRPEYCSDMILALEEAKKVVPADD